MSKKLNNENQHNQIILNNSNSYTCQYGYLHKYKKIDNFKIINKEYHSIQELKNDIEKT